MIVGYEAIAWCLSPTRRVAAKLIRQKTIKNSRDVVRWNVGFYIFALLVFIISSFADKLHYKIPVLVYILFALVAFSRINELILAFYGDALARLEGEHPRLRINRSNRINLLALGYIEIISQFPIFHYAAMKIGFGIYRDVSGIFDLLYFSVMTITTTGFGDIVPVSIFSKITTIYEVGVGIVFLALALAAYLSGDAAHYSAGGQVEFENGQWKIADGYLFSKTPSAPYEYNIELSRLTETGSAGRGRLYDWPLQMAEKTWVDWEDFLQAYRAALDIAKGEYKPILNSRLLEESIAEAERFRGRYT